MATKPKSIPIGQIKSNPKNPRVIKNEKFKQLVRSIDEFPEMMEKRKMVCITDTDGKIYPLGGNQRYKALLELGFKTIPEKWIEMADEWSEEQRNKFIIKDNVHAGEWDEVALLTDFSKNQLSDWGLDVLTLEDIDTTDVNDEFKRKFESIKDPDAVYPIVPKFDERHQAFIIVVENEVDANWLRETLGMQKMKSYKSSEVAKSNVIHFKDFKNAIDNSNAES